MAGDVLSGRRRRQPEARCRSVRFDLSEAEYAELAAAADAAGLARGAFAAKATLAAVRGSSTPAGAPAAGALREVLAELMRASTLVQRIGVNLNQAVAQLNATGQAPGSLVPIAEHCAHRVELLDQVAEQVRNRIR